VSGGGTEMASLKCWFWTVREHIPREDVEPTAKLYCMHYHTGQDSCNLSVTSHDHNYSAGVYTVYHTLSRMRRTCPLQVAGLRSEVSFLNIATQLSAPELAALFPVSSQMALRRSSSDKLSAFSTKRCRREITYPDYQLL
jgi:hypothetical protein